MKGLDIDPGWFEHPLVRSQLTKDPEDARELLVGLHARICELEQRFPNVKFRDILEAAHEPARARVAMTLQAAGADLDDIVRVCGEQQTSYGMGGFTVEDFEACYTGLTSRQLASELGYGQNRAERIRALRSPITFEQLEIARFIVEEGGTQVAAEEKFTKGRGYVVRAALGRYFYRIWLRHHHPEETDLISEIEKVAA